jgi:hypothetical protein
VSTVGAVSFVATTREALVLSPTPEELIDVSREMSAASPAVDAASIQLTSIRPVDRARIATADCAKVFRARSKASFQNLLVLKI